MNKIFLACFLAVIGFLGGVYFNSWRYSHGLIQGSKTQIQTLTPIQFQQALNSGQYLLLDVRTADEYAGGHIKNSLPKDYYQTQAFSDFLDSLDKKGKYLVYCRAGRRSAEVLKLMESKGFTQVSDLAGGINAWVEAGLPVEK